VNGHVRFVAVLGLVACSTSSSSKSPVFTSVSGTLMGRSVSPAYATAAKGIYDQEYPNQVTVFIASSSNPCGMLQQLVTNPNVERANLLAIALVLGATDASAVVTPGTYTANGNPDELSASYSSYDAQCNMTGSEATAESVTLTSAGSSYEGTFDLTFGPDHVTGSFVAPLCDVTVPTVDAQTGDAMTATFDASVVCEP
jgi:hypothetical protein